MDESEAPYFVDLVHDQFDAKARRSRFQSRRTAHLHLARSRSAAPGIEAIDSTIHEVDTQVERLHARDKKLGKPYIYPQVALMALNPHTGQVLALVGGRSYGNFAVEPRGGQRPTGSIFKPFVYAAAFQRR